MLQLGIVAQTPSLTSAVSPAIRPLPSPHLIPDTTQTYPGTKGNLLFPLGHVSPSLSVRPQGARSPRCSLVFHGRVLSACLLACLLTRRAKRPHDATQVSGKRAPPCLSLLVPVATDLIRVRLRRWTYQTLALCFSPGRLTRGARRRAKQPCAVLVLVQWKRFGGPGGMAISSPAVTRRRAVCLSAANKGRR